MPQRIQGYVGYERVMKLYLIGKPETATGRRWHFYIKKQRDFSFATSGARLGQHQDASLQSRLHMWVTGTSTWAMTCCLPGCKLTGS